MRSLMSAGLVLALLALTGSPALAEGEKKSWEAQNVSWALPDGWSWQDLSPQMKQNGFLGFAGHGAGINAYLRAVTSDLELQAFAQELLQAGRNQCSEVTGTSVSASTLAGVDGSLVRVQGKKGDADLYVLGYAMRQGQHLYALFVLCFHGTQASQAEAIHAMKRGVTLISGGGEEPADAPAHPDLDGDAAGASPLGDTWPENGPVKDGNVISIPPQNLTWTLPEETPFTFIRVIDTMEPDLSQGAPLFLALQAKQAGEEAELVCEVLLFVHKREGSQLPQEIIQRLHFQESISKPFGHPLPGRTQIDARTRIGKFDGARITMPCQNKEGVFTTVSAGLASFGARMYQVRVICRGARDVAQTFAKDVDALLAGLGPINEHEPAPGPYQGLVTSFEARGTHRGAEKDLRGPGYTFKKPASFAKLAVGSTGLALAVEHRDDEQGVYLYLDCRTVNMSDLGREGKDMDDLADADKTNFESGDIEAAEVPEDGDYKKVRFGRAKGVGDVFTGTFLGVPLAHHLFVVKHKQKAYIIRVQFIGPDAESKLKKVFKTVQKNWKWTR